MMHKYNIMHHLKIISKLAVRLPAVRHSNTTPVYRSCIFYAEKRWQPIDRQG